MHACVKYGYEVHVRHMCIVNYPCIWDQGLTYYVYKFVTYVTCMIASLCVWVFSLCECVSYVRSVSYECGCVVYVHVQEYDVYVRCVTHVVECVTYMHECVSYVRFISYVHEGITYVC